jgi:hypothetical protein
MSPPAYAATTTQSSTPSKPKEEMELLGIAGTRARRRSPRPWIQNTSITKSYNLFVPAELNPRSGGIDPMKAIPYR